MALSGRTFGVEIEAYNIDSHELARELNNTPGIACKYEGYTHRTTPHWKVVTDSSLDGNYHSFELVSPIFSGEDGIKQILTACEVLNRLGAKVNSKCGIHVHFGMRDTTIRQRRNVCAAYARSETLIDRIMPESRRGNNAYYARSLVCVGETGTQCLDRIRTEENHYEFCRGLYDGTTGASERYHKINARAAFDTHGTFEFRQHSGSTDGLKITSWIKFLDALIRDACESPDIKPWQEGVTLKFSKLLMRIGLDTDTRKYLIKREKEVNASTDSANAEETRSQLVPARPVRRRVNRNAPVTTPVPAVPETQEISVTVIGLLTPGQRESITELQAVARRNSWYLMTQESRIRAVNEVTDFLEGRAVSITELCTYLGLSTTGMTEVQVITASGEIPRNPLTGIGYLTPIQRDQLTEEMRIQRRAQWYAMDDDARFAIRVSLIDNWNWDYAIMSIDFCTRLGLSTLGMTSYQVAYAEGTLPDNNPYAYPLGEENYILPVTYADEQSPDGVARTATEHARFRMLLRTESASHPTNNSQEILIRAQRTEDLFYMRRRSIHSALANRSDEFYTGLFQHNELFRAYFYGTNNAPDEQYRLNLRTTVTESLVEETVESTVPACIAPLPANEIGRLPAEELERRLQIWNRMTDRQRSDARINVNTNGSMHADDMCRGLGLPVFAQTHSINVLYGYVGINGTVNTDLQGEPELPELSTVDLPYTYQYTAYNAGHGDYDGVERTDGEWNRYREIHGDLLVNHAARYAGGVIAWQELDQDVSATENLFQRRQDTFTASHPGYTPEQYREFFATSPYFSMYATSAGAVYANNLLEGYFRERDRNQTEETARELAELLP